MMGINSCRMICAVIYGYTPMDKTEKFLMVPPESRFKKPRKPPAFPLWKKASNTARLTPGAGTFAARRNRTKMPNVKSSFFRISSERHKNRQADCFFSGMVSFLLLCDQLNAAAGLFDLGFGPGTDTMDADLQGHGH